MPVIRARLGHHIDLTTCLGTIFRIVQGAVDAILFDCILRDLQTRLRFLSLLLNASRVDPVNLEVVVITRTSGETNCALITAPVILGKGG